MIWTSETRLRTSLFMPGEAVATPVGQLLVARHGVMEESVFTYGERYRNHPDAMALNPAFMPVAQVVFETPPCRIRDGGTLSLTIRDALPDAWGELVLRCQNDWQPLTPTDMLLLTNEDRAGAMVFSPAGSEVPPPVPLPPYRLEDLADAAQRLVFDMEVPKSLRRLLLKGGSLGGARPKVALVHRDEAWIAKFSARDDEVDVPLLEFCTLRLAERCGIRVPACELVRMGKQHVLLLRRFDRPGLAVSGLRTHYLSAAAFTDSPYASDKGSYVALAQQLRRHGSGVKRDLSELFRRLVFNLLIDNSDDHVKNHGVLHVGSNRYALSPAFDLVPQLSNLGYMGMAITEGNNVPHLDGALAATSHFGLSQEEGAKIIADVRASVSGWCEVFVAAGADAGLLRRVESTFVRQAKLVGG